MKVLLIITAFLAASTSSFNQVQKRRVIPLTQLHANGNPVQKSNTKTVGFKQIAAAIMTITLFHSPVVARSDADGLNYTMPPQYDPSLASDLKCVGADVEITNPLTEVVEFFDFKSKLKDNELKRSFDREAEQRALKAKGIENFDSFQATAVQKLSEATETTKYDERDDGFSVTVPTSWLVTKKDKDAQASGQFLTEKIMLVGSSYSEGSSFSVTRTYASRLLKDFEVEWWFAPLPSLSDLGTADNVAKLLVLQRQGEFEKKNTASIIRNAVIKNNVLEFDFETPLPNLPEVTRSTAVRAYYRPNSDKYPGGILDTVWVSALTKVFNSEIGTKLYDIRSSFVISN